MISKYDILRMVSIKGLAYYGDLSERFASTERNYDDFNICLRLLIDEGYLEAHRYSDNPCTDKFENCYFSFTPHGYGLWCDYLIQTANVKAAKRNSDIRFIITTIIAVAALFIAIFKP